MTDLFDGHVCMEGEGFCLKRNWTGKTWCGCSRETGRASYNGPIDFDLGTKNVLIGQSCYDSNGSDAGTGRGDVSSNVMRL